MNGLLVRRESDENVPQFHVDRADKGVDEFQFDFENEKDISH